MAHVNFHYIHDAVTKTIPEVSAASIPSATVLRINVLGGDQISMFFENDAELINFVDRVDQALTAYLIERGEK